MRLFILTRVNGEKLYVTWNRGRRSIAAETPQIQSRDIYYRQTLKNLRVFMLMNSYTYPEVQEFNYKSVEEMKYNHPELFI